MKAKFRKEVFSNVVYSDGGRPRRVVLIDPNDPRTVFRIVGNLFITQEDDEEFMDEVIVFLIMVLPGEKWLTDPTKINYDDFDHRFLMYHARVNFHDLQKISVYIPVDSDTRRKLLEGDQLAIIYVAPALVSCDYILTVFSLE